MPRPRFLVATVVFGIVVGGLGARASTWGLTVTTFGYWVNDSSFTSEAMEGPISRVAEWSGHFWGARTGGSSQQLRLLGVDNGLSGCVPGNQNHVWGDPGCNFWDPLLGSSACSTLAYHNPTSCFGAWEVRVFLGSANFRILPTDVRASAGNQMDIGDLLTHELGHNFMGHTTAGAQPCIMDPGTNPTQSVRTSGNPCPWEVETMANATAHPRDAVWLTQTTSFPIPTGSWGAKTQVGPRYGAAFGSGTRGVASGTIKDSFFFLDNTVAPHAVSTCDYAFGAGNCAVVGTGVLFTRAAAVGYDFGREQWWLVGSDASFGFGNPEGTTLEIYSTYDRVNYSYRGSVFAGSTLIRTKNPPAVAYDARTDRILVAFTRSDGAVMPPCGWNGGSGGCVNDTNIVSFSAGSTGTLRWSPRVEFVWNPSFFALTSFGTPALACTNVTYPWTTSSCLIVVNGRDAPRSLYSWRFGLVGGQGTLALWEGLDTVGGGMTNMRPSLAMSNPLYDTSAFTVAVTGTGGQVFVNSKTDLWASWSGWNAVSSLGTPVMTSQPPLILSRMNATGYDLLVAP